MLKDISSICAIVTSTFCLFPQIFQVIKSKSTRDLSLGTICLYLASSLSWITYGSCIQDTAITITNVISGLCCFTLITLKLFFEHKDRFFS